MLQEQPPSCLKITGERCLLVKRLTFDKQLKPSHLVYKDNKHPPKGLNTSYELDEDIDDHHGGDYKNNSSLQVEITNLDLKMIQFKQLRHRNLCRVLDVEIDT